MRILHINEHLEWSGGVETYLLSVIPELEARGHEQAVAFARGRAELAQRSYSMPSLSHGSKHAEASAEVDMHGILDEVEPDVVHLHQVYNIGAVRACLQRVPVLIHGHDYRYLCPASTFYYRRQRAVCNRTAGPGCFPTTVFRHCMSPRPRFAMDYYRRVRWITANAVGFAGVVAPSESARQRFIQSGFENQAVHTMPYFCSLTVRDVVREIPREPTVTFLGRIAPNKGLDVFIRALGNLPGHVRGIVVGNLPDNGVMFLRELAVQSGCDERIEFRNWASRDEISALFQETSVFVFPSVWPETLGIVGLEALANGVPVVASDIGGTSEWCVEGETGYRVAPKDDVAFADSILELLEDHAKLVKFGENGLRLIRERFAPTVHLDRLETLYRNVVVA